MTRSEPLNVRIPAGLMDDLKLWAEGHATTVSKIVRETLEEAAAKWKHLPSSLIARDLHPAVAAAYDGGQVLVVVPFMSQVPPILDRFDAQLEGFDGRRTYRAAGNAGIRFLNGGRLDFASIRSLDSRVRGHLLDLVYFADMHARHLDLEESVRPSLIARRGEIVWGSA